MSDLINREDAVKTIIRMCAPICDATNDLVAEINALTSAEAEPKENHAQATGAKHVIKSLGTDSISHNGIDCTEFIHWLMEEVMDDEMWELNAVGNGEIICRKLVKLGVLEVTEEPSYYIRPSADAEWIPVKTRPMDEEERREWSEKFGYDIEYDEAVIYTSQLPDDGQAVLTCDLYGNITIDIFENDPDYGCGFEKIGDMDGIVAWMPLPTPYKGGDDE